MSRRIVRGGMIALSMLATVAGCGGATPSPRVADEEIADPRPEPETLLPADSFAYVRVDVDRLRRSPYAPTVARWYRSWGSLVTEGDDEAQIFAELAELLIEHADEVVLAAFACSEARCEPEVAVVFQGDFTGEPVEELAWRIPRSDRVLEERTVEGRAALVVDDNDELAGVRLGHHTWLWAPLPWVKRALREGHRGAGPLSGPALSSLAERVDAGDAAVTAMVAPPAGEAPRLFGELEMDGSDRIRRAALQLDASDGFEMRMLADAGSEGGARTLAASTERTAGESAEHPLAILLGLDELVAASTIDVAGEAVEVHTRIGDLRTRQLLFHWEKLAGAAAAFFGGENEGSLGHLLGLMPRTNPPRADEPPAPPRPPRSPEEPPAPAPDATGPTPR